MLVTYSADQGSAFGGFVWLSNVHLLNCIYLKNFGWDFCWNGSSRLKSDFIAIAWWQLILMVRALE